jgi:hypothetical protein
MPVPETNLSSRGTSEGADEAPVTEVQEVVAGEAEERAGADDKIQDLQQAFAMAREWFDPGKKLPEGKQNGGS